MSKYTTEVRFICETAAGLDMSEGYLSVNQIVKAALPSVFDFDFPIFDEAYRPLLETKILKHFYTREIGLETVGLWKLKLDTKLNEIMPFYNQLYKSELIEFNPMYDVDLTRDHKLNKTETTTQKGTEDITASKNGNISDNTNVDETTTQDTLNESTTNNTSETNINNTTGSTSEETASATKTHYDKYSDTPQGSLTNVQNDTYLTNARMVSDNDGQSGKTTVNGIDESNGTTTSETTGNETGFNTTEVSSNTRKDIETTDSENRNATQTANKDLNSIDDYLEHVKGKNGGVSYSTMLMEYRNTFLNIDMQVINELNDLFLNLW